MYEHLVNTRQEHAVVQDQSLAAQSACSRTIQQREQWRYGYLDAREG